MPRQADLPRRLLSVLSVWIGLTTSILAQTPAAPNVIPLTMRTPRGGFDRLVVAVEVCAPGATRCATIDDVMVDTGSTGLRLEASAVPDWLTLPPLLGPDDRPVAECIRFVHDADWGPLVRADLHLGGLTATDIPIQVIADTGASQPAACPHSAVAPTSNGTLGVGPQLYDCRGSCAQDPTRPGVFVEEGDAWVPLQEPVAPPYRLPNPVSRLVGYDNGVVFDMPASPEGGSVAVRGTLTFGVGTAANNRLGSAAMVRLDAKGRFTTFYAGAAYPESYVDSGTETFVLADDTLPRCAGMLWAFCATPDARRNATMVGLGGTGTAVSLKVGDYAGMRSRHVGASDAFAVAAQPQSPAFVWGAPFFLGRRVSVLIEGRSAPGSAGIVGPAYAIQ